MALNAQRQTGMFTKRTKQISTQSIVEIKFSEDTGDIIAVYPQISPSSCEVASGRATYGGRLICTLVYVDSEGKLCRIQKGAEFSHYADDESLASAQRGVCSLRCERTRVKREGSLLAVEVVVGADIAVYATVGREYIADIEGAICRSESLKLISTVNFSGESEVEDDFDCVAADVLVPAANVIVTDCNVRSGVAEVDGEIYISLLALRDNKPVCFERTVPFKSELPCEGATLAKRAYCGAAISSVSVDCKVNEDRGTCNVTATVALSFEGHYFEEESANCVTDAFCTEGDIKLDFCDEEVLTDSEVKVYSERVSGLAATGAKLDYTCVFLAAALPRAEYALNGSELEGSVGATLLYEQGGEIRSAEVTLPFSVKLKALSQNCRRAEVAVSGMSLRQRAEGECEAEATLRISAFDGEYCRARYVTSAEERNLSVHKLSAISVYISSAGDDIWDVAKKLKQSPESISRSNPDLKFPLTGKERVLVYRSGKA